MRALSLSVLLGAVSMVGCHKSPIERTHDAAGGAVGTIAAVGTYRIFNNELSSGGGAFEYPGGENQTLAFDDRSNPLSQRSIRYSWNGQPAASGSTDHTFAGFDLMHTTSLSAYTSTPGRDLRYAGFHKVTFFARGSLDPYTVLKIESADDGNPLTPDACLTLSANGTGDACGGTGAQGVLENAWRQYSLVIPASNFASVKDFFKATFVHTDPIPGLPAQQPGQGGTAYFDEIQYEP